MGREISDKNERYGLHIFLLLFFDEYQTCYSVLIDKKPISVKCKQEQYNNNQFSSQKVHLSIIDTGRL